MAMLLWEYTYVLYIICISTTQVSLIEGTGIDSFEPFWFLGPSNSAPTGKGSPVTRQQIDPHKFGEKIPFQIMSHTYIMVLVHCPKQLL